MLEPGGARGAGRYGGLLPVGQAFVAPTGHCRLPFLVVAPTMELPADISGTSNVLAATRAALRAVLAHNRHAREHGGHPIAELLLPGMGTGVGAMHPFVAAAQMRRAFEAAFPE